MVDAVQQASVAPTVGGDRPRVILTVTYQDLINKCTQAELVTTGQRLTPGELRRLACDADILPVVMSGHSVPMDVGAACRLVTPEIRAALVLRDRGCVFPGCVLRQGSLRLTPNPGQVVVWSGGLEGRLVGLSGQVVFVL